MPPLSSNPTGGGLLAVLLEMRSDLLRYLRLRGASTEEAEDIVQDMALKIAQATIGPVEQPRAYLYRMATNHFLLLRRTAQRRARRDEDWVGAGAGDTREIDASPSAEAELIARDQLAFVQRLIDLMPERTRTIFRRFRLGGEPQRQIAADIGISTSAVEKHLARAYGEISRIRRRLDEETDGARHLDKGKNRHDR